MSHKQHSRPKRLLFQPAGHTTRPTRPESSLQDFVERTRYPDWRSSALSSQLVLRGPSGCCAASLSGRASRWHQYHGDLHTPVYAPTAERAPIRPAGIGSEGLTPSNMSKPGHWPMYSHPSAYVERCRFLPWPNSPRRLPSIHTADNRLRRLVTIELTGWLFHKAHGDGLNLQLLW